VFESPAAPDASDSGSGIDEDSVEVEQDAAAEDFFHREILAGFVGSAGKRRVANQSNFGWDGEGRRMKSEERSFGL